LITPALCEVNQDVIFVLVELEEVHHAHAFHHVVIPESASANIKILYPRHSIQIQCEILGKMMGQNKPKVPIVRKTSHGMLIHAGPG